MFKEYKKLQFINNNLQIKKIKFLNSIHLNENIFEMFYYYIIKIFQNFIVL